MTTVQKKENHAGRTFECFPGNVAIPVSENSNARTLSKCLVPLEFSLTCSMSCLSGLRPPPRHTSMPPDPITYTRATYARTPRMPHTSRALSGNHRWQCHTRARTAPRASTGTHSARRPNWNTVRLVRYDERRCRSVRTQYSTGLVTFCSCSGQMRV